MVRILQVHNYYGSSSPSGENAVVDQERHLLANAGHDVDVFSRHSDKIRFAGRWGLLIGAASTTWNPRAARALAEKVNVFRPQIVHVHNTFPLVSPAIFWTLRGHATRVLTLHNYRLFCAAGIPMRNSAVCTLCLDRRSAWPGLLYGCYRKSRAASLPLSLNIGLHRAIGTWRNQVDAFIVLSEFQRETMVRAGLPAKTVHVKPNFHPGNPVMVPWQKRDGHVVFVGRLSPEKGVLSLIEAWRRWGPAAPRLTIIGDGEERLALQRAAAGLSIDFRGHVASKEAVATIARARLLVLPSEWFEGFPMVLGEAFAQGTPVAVSEIGPLPALVNEPGAGISFPPANPAAMQASLARAWADQASLAAMGTRARHAFENSYTEAASLALLLDIYAAAERARAERQSPGSRP